MLALLIGAQFATRSMSQFVTGSLVNMILHVSVLTLGIGGGLTVAILSPLLAFLAGIGPAFIQIIPIMAAGNAVLVLITNLIKRRAAKANPKDLALTGAVILAAGAAKTLFLWVGITVIALPLIPGLNDMQKSVIASAFSWPQLVTAAIGGALAMAVTPLLRLALRDVN
jgi:hypothetical protein